jgi:hypothetical protein
MVSLHFADEKCSDTDDCGSIVMACIEISIDSQAELMQIITELVIAAAGDKQSALELFAEKLEEKGFGWIAHIIFNGIVSDVTPWHSGYNIKFTDTFTTKHARVE